MAVVDVFLCWGQSNMQGRGSGAQAPATTPGLALVWDSADGSLDQLSDPQGASPYAPQTGSCLPAFANSLTAASERPAVFVRAAVGGTALLSANNGGSGGWWSGANVYNNAVTRFNTALADIAATHTIGTVSLLGHQGERDAQGGNSLDTYEAALTGLLGRFRTSLALPDLPMYLMRLGAGVDPEPAGWATVRAAQDAACASTEGMKMAYTRCADFHGLGWMNADGLHYSQAGYNDMGAQAGSFVAADFGYAPPPDPYQPAGPRTSRCARRLLDVI